MCGLWGAASSFLSVDEMYNVGMLGYLNYFRGKDATGMAIADYADEGINYSFIKSIKPSHAFLNDEVVHKWFKNQSAPTAMIGHTRAATFGDLGKANAHPFHFKDIIGAHN